jgi:integrase
MPVYKDKKQNSWYVMATYRELDGTKKKKCKRGFTTKRDAKEWEDQFHFQNDASMNMTLESFSKLYLDDIRPRLKKTTMLEKENVIGTKIIPALGNRKMNEISGRDVLLWQNMLLSYRDSKGKSYSETYLRKMHSEINALFNHAVRHYDLRLNPVGKVGSIGTKKCSEMQFWTQEEYLRFADAVMGKPMQYYAFEMLYWTGLRIGELFALTPEDFDFEKKTVRINKSYQRLKKQDVITTPKTRKSIRTVTMPDTLSEEMQECIRLQYGLKPTDRVFAGISKTILHKEMMNAAKTAGVKRIRIHDLRHSHVSLLIELGFSPLAIADRVGHESIDITYRYAHLFPNKQSEMAISLEARRRPENVQKNT